MREEIKRARNNADISQQTMSDILKIPKRTIESWEVGERACPAWAESLVIKALEGIKEGRMLFTDWTIERLSVEAKKCYSAETFIKKYNSEPWTEEFSNEKVEDILKGIFEESNP